jgi:hypothetical protein
VTQTVGIAHHLSYPIRSNRSRRLVNGQGDDPAIDWRSDLSEISQSGQDEGVAILIGVVSGFDGQISSVSIRCCLTVAYNRSVVARPKWFNAMMKVPLCA